MELVFGDRRPAGPRGIQVARVLFLEMLDQVAQIAFLVPPARLIARTHQQEAGVVAVGGQDPVALFAEPAVDRPAIAHGGPLVHPGRALDVEVETRLVGRREGRLGRAPGMEPQVIQTVRLAHAEDPPPSVDVGGRIAGLGEDAALERAAEENLLPVQRELRVLDFEVSQTERHITTVGPLSTGHLGNQFHVELVKRRLEFVPSPPVARRQQPVHRQPAGGNRGRELRLVRAGAKRNLNPAFGAGRVAQTQRHTRPPAGQIGIDLHVVDPHRVGGRELDTAHDAVPVALGVVRHAMRVGAHPRRTSGYRRAR